MRTVTSCKGGSEGAGRTPDGYGDEVRRARSVLSRGRRRSCRLVTAIPAAKTPNPHRCVKGVDVLPVGEERLHQAFGSKLVIGFGSHG